MNSPIFIWDAQAIKPSDFKKGCALVWEDELQSFVGKIPLTIQELVGDISSINKNVVKRLDRSVLLALHCANRLEKEKFKHLKTIVSMGSSRGATGVWEKNFMDFYLQERLSPYASPTTSLGNITSWLAQLFQYTTEVEISMTCSTASASILNAIAWLSSGLAEVAIVGGAEAPLTPFTIAQMKALRIVASSTSSEKFPCRASDLNKQHNTMVLGEGAACFSLSKKTIHSHPLAAIIGWGSASENIHHPTEQSPDGINFQKAMQEATIGRIPDLIITHTPGTLIGDRAELEAVKKVFPSQPPYINIKWRDGHSLGASGALSVFEAIQILQYQQLSELPPWLKGQKFPEAIKTILINTAGFGGQAVSLLLAHPKFL